MILSVPWHVRGWPRGVHVAQPHHISQRGVGPGQVLHWEARLGHGWGQAENVCCARIMGWRNAFQVVCVCFIQKKTNPEYLPCNTVGTRISQTDLTLNYSCRRNPPTPTSKSRPVRPVPSRLRVVVQQREGLRVRPLRRRRRQWIARKAYVFTNK